MLRREIQIFCSYSHRDDELREKIEDYLVSLRRGGLATVWHDRRIEPGEEWRREIDEHLETADIVLLLISNDFLLSDYCYNIEMTRALERRRDGKVRVIPVILRYCDWESAKVGSGDQKIALGELQAIPVRPAPESRLVPIESWQHSSEAFTTVAQAIREVVEGMTTGQSPERSQTESQQTPDVPDLIPHLCNRSRQEKALRDSIRDWRKHGKVKRPLVFIIHGDVDECHEMYQRRLTEETLPRLLRSKAESESEVSSAPSETVSLETFFVPLLGYYPVKVPFDFLRSELGQAVVDDVDASPKVIARAISEQKKPMMFSSYLSSFDWEPDGSKIIEAYLRFWNAMPEILSGPPVICCLFFKYHEPSGEEKNNAARTYLKSLSETLTSYRRIRAVVLDELPSVNYSDVDNWIKESRYFRSLCPVHTRSLCNVPKAAASIDSIFTTAEAKSHGGNLPMQLIAPKLIQLIKENRCQKE